MTVLQTVAVAFSMFSALPMPRVLAALMELEFAGAAASHPGQLYTAER